MSEKGCSVLSVRDSFPSNQKSDLPNFCLSDTLYKSSLGVALLRDGNPTPFSATLPTVASGERAGLVNPSEKCW